MGQFFRGAAKIAVAIVGAVVVLSILGGIAAWGLEKVKQNKNAPYETVRSWTFDLPNLQMKIIGKTKLIDGQMYADFLFQGYPEFLGSTKNRLNDSAGFNIGFMDKDGFEVANKKLLLSEGTRIMGPDGKPVATQWTYKEYVGLESYARFEAINVGWSLNTEAPAEPKPIKPAADSLGLDDKSSDHCAPGLSKAERLRRLAKHGTVRQVGDEQYKAGGHTVWYSTTYLIDCN
jgi:hypothetical protein